ncbi:MAG: YeeE/YedE family protein [Chlamydiia bacterium]|nr:YeeE/YedE family protein [Chlamydiia bacterium]
MEITLASLGVLFSGLIAGLFFGFLLRKGHVSRFDVIVGQFKLQDFTVVKIMLTAVVVGSIGVYAMSSFWGVEILHIKPLTVWGNLLGGLIFGVGMALMGLCPGTCVAALGEGTSHAVWGFLGMLVGTWLYALVYDDVKALILDKLTYGKETLPMATNLSPWWFIGGTLVFALILFSLIEKYESTKKS